MLAPKKKLQKNSVKLLVGLGNPGGKYCRTRHNLGFLALDRFVEAGVCSSESPMEAPVKTTVSAWGRMLQVFARGRSTQSTRSAHTKHNALCMQVRCGDHDVLAIKPQTFMNRSGIAVRAFVEHYAIPLEDVIVLCDDVALPFGRIRIRASGSSGGHNGLRSIAECLGSENFTRLRLGVASSAMESVDLADFVLSDFFDEELALLPVYLGNVCAALRVVIQGDTNTAMNMWHGRDCTQA